MAALRVLFLTSVCVIWWFFSSPQNCCTYCCIVKRSERSSPGALRDNIHYMILYPPLHLSKLCKVLGCCEMFVGWLQLVFFSPTPWHSVSVFHFRQVLLKPSCCWLLGSSHMPHVECFLWAVFEQKTPGRTDCEFLIVLQSIHKMAASSADEMSGRDEWYPPLNTVYIFVICVYFFFSQMWNIIACCCLKYCLTFFKANLSWWDSEENGHLHLYFINVFKCLNVVSL